MNPLESNPKFEEWKKKYVDTPAPEPIIKLSENEQHAINSYISSEAYTWNDKLRRGVKLTKEEKKQISNLDSALQKMPTYQGVLYRSVSDFGIPDVQEFIVGHKPVWKLVFLNFFQVPLRYMMTVSRFSMLLHQRPGEIYGNLTLRKKRFCLKEIRCSTYPRWLIT